jgi:hypothetical protein
VYFGSVLRRILFNTKNAVAMILDGEMDGMNFGWFSSFRSEAAFEQLTRRAIPGNQSPV